MPLEARRSEKVYPRNKLAFLAGFLVARTRAVRALIEEERGGAVSLNGLDEELKRRISLSKEKILRETERLGKEFGLAGIFWKSPPELDQDLDVLSRSGVIRVEGERVMIDGEFGLSLGEGFSLSEGIEESIAKGAREETGAT